MKQHSIWNRVQACIYKSNKSWGAKDESYVEVLVGTSAKNSHSFVNHRTTHRTFDDGTQEFRFYVDGVCIKRGIIKPRKRKSDCILEFIDPPQLDDRQAA